MDLYSTLLSIHVLGALALFGSFGVEAAGLGRLRRGSAPEPGALRRLRRGQRLGAAAALAIVFPGSAMMALRWGPDPWIVTAIGGVVLMAAASARVRPAIRELARGSAEGLPALRGSLWLRTASALGILALMTTKPGWLGSAAALSIALAAGAGIGWWSAGRERIRPTEEARAASVPVRTP